MTTKPPYTITEKAADYLAKIVESVTRLEFGTDFTRDIRLHRENRMRTIHSSLAIEGNTLSEGEIAAVLEGKFVAGKQEEIKEARNAYEAYDKIKTFDPYAVKDFLKAHKLMTAGLINEAGKFRSGDVGVFDGDKAVHMGARPKFVPELIAELFRWAANSEIHPVLKSAILHYEIETIHPFEDGNGRMGRLWQTLVIAKWNELFTWMPMESILYQNRSQYYKVIEDARRANDSGVFIEFTLSALLETIKLQAKHKEDSGKFAEKFVENIDEFVEKFAKNDTQKAIIRLIIAHPTISAKKIAEEMGMSSRGIQKSIENLKQRGLLERIGPAKGGHWLVKMPE
jgi:Fic family protein